MRSRLWSVLAALLILFMSPAAARADWLRAESERFVVYSDSDESVLRAYVQKLETFDRVLRFRNGLPMDAVPPRKLPIYLVRNRAGLLEVHPAAGSDVAGTYFTADEDIFAIAIRSRSSEWIMLHEYAHHFMLQNFSAGYPSWFVEGFAEYYMTAEISRGSVSVGSYNEDRVWWLSEDWLSLEDLLSKKPSEIVNEGDRATYYPVAWLLTHWFMGSEERRPQLDAYIRAVGRGEDPVEAMEQAVGMSLTELRLALRSYLRGNMPYVRINYDFPQAEVIITELPESADDLLLLAQRLKIGVADDQREATADEVRRAAARHPHDRFARLTLGHAELHFGDPAAGEAILLDLLERDPDNIEALQLMATERMRQAGDSPEDAERLLGEARGFLARAYRVDDANYATFSLIAETRMGAHDYPTDNDMATWELAFTLAPQLGSIRMGAAHALMLRDRHDAAIAILEPLANSPHGGEGSAAAQQMIARAEAEMAMAALMDGAKEESFDGEEMSMESGAAAGDGAETAENR